MSLISRLKELKEDLEALSAKRAKAEGKYEQALAALEELGYSSIEDAQDALTEMIQNKTNLEAEAEQILEELHDKYSEFLE